MQRATGQRPPELDEVEPPAGGEALMGVFLELDRTRRSTGFGPGPIALADIDAWIRIHGARLTSWEVDTLCEMDGAALQAVTEAMRRKPGGKG